ncbi:hypothetical protein LWI29_027530 [Acer saccharum]|uniref:RNA-dependent RNA polymerase n=1 Tax=Acer saccharum TaxID=4024 RepID=A0AA39SWE6_ACESA|nr:hypothetical protein LWI29_027530 [Acer saccharum]
MVVATTDADSASPPSQPPPPSEEVDGKLPPPFAISIANLSASYHRRSRSRRFRRARDAGSTIGEVEVVDVIEVGKLKGTRTHAIVEFATIEAAELIKSLAAADRLRFKKFYLKAWDMEQNSRTSHSQHKIYNVKLSVGRQISEEKFSVLWSQENVSVKFGTDLGKFSFFLTYNSVEYKLEVSYESILKVKLRSPRGQTAMFLVIQLNGAPQIYKNDGQWFREVDFTPSSSIAQSNALYLRFPGRDVVPKILKDFFYYEESEGEFILERGSSFSSKSRTLPELPPLKDGWVYVRKILITPTKMYCCGLEASLSNRVLRSYPDDIDNFLRISFIDEDGQKLYATALSPQTSSSTGKEKRTRIYQRIRSILRNGINIGGKKFETLAFSNSQLRKNSLWMFASRPGLTAADIRKGIGDFSDIKNVAKYAARLGQSFGSSREALHVHSSEVEEIPDVERNRGGKKYTFSDGIGKISADLAHILSRKLGYTSYTPSAFQIRYGGCKGVVAVDPNSTVKLSLRKSMSKYKSNSTSLDVLACSRYQPFFLNRELITLMSTLGVRDYVFERNQREAVAQLDAILSDPVRAHEALDLMASSRENANVLKEMLTCDYKPDKEPYLSMMLQTFRAFHLQELRSRTRIFVQNGQAMMGCLDETGTLKYGQVFVQYSGSRSHHPNNTSPVFSIVESKVVVAKNPCLHPGDMRVLEAVDVPALHHMVDCIVFPAKGKRPHPDECSGSDLDGDVYFVCWDPDLIPPRQVPPMDYTPAPAKVSDNDVTIEDIEEYFVDYIMNDSLGVICHAHVVFADTEPNKAMSNSCKELARLASIAVDFAKTGVPAKIPRSLRVKEYPDFMEKEDKPTYKSPCVLGKLYREVKDIAPPTAAIKSFTRKVAKLSYDPAMEVEGFKKYIKKAFYYKTQYDKKLGKLMDYYGINTEAEIISGCIMKMERFFDRKRVTEEISFAVRSLREEAKAWFNKTESDPATPTTEKEMYAKASAWYHVTYHHSYWGRYNQGMNRDHFLSFAWSVYDKLVDIKKGKLISGPEKRRTTGKARKIVPRPTPVPCTRPAASTKQPFMSRDR